MSRTATEPASSRRRVLDAGAAERVCIPAPPLVLGHSRLWNLLVSYPIVCLISLKNATEMRVPQYAASVLSGAFLLDGSIF